jgi:cytoskeletal protein RodZ
MASLEEIGATLKEARESLGISLEDVENRTHISRKHLKAIEMGDKTSLPELFYVRGFLKKYAEMVGLSPNEVADAYQTAPKIALGTPDERFTVGPMAYYVAILVGVAGILALAWHFQPKLSVVTLPSPALELSPAPAQAASPPKELGPLPQKAASSAQMAKIASDASTVAPLPADKPSGTEEKASVVVGIALSDRSWVQIKLNGKQIYSGTLLVGDQRRFSGQSVSVTAGNAGGVEITLNGQPQGPLGPKGKVVTHTYKP